MCSMMAISIIIKVFLKKWGTLIGFITGGLLVAKAIYDTSDQEEINPVVDEGSQKQVAENKNVEMATGNHERSRAPELDIKPQRHYSKDDRDHISKAFRTLRTALQNEADPLQLKVQRLRQAWSQKADRNLPQKDFEEPIELGQKLLSANVFDETKFEVFRRLRALRNQAKNWSEYHAISSIRAMPGSVGL